MNLGITLKEIRESKGLKQTWVAEQMGISAVQLSLLESGNRKLSPDRFLSICQVLQIEPNMVITKVLENLEDDDIIKGKEDSFNSVKKDLFDLIFNLLEDISKDS